MNDAGASLETACEPDHVERMLHRLEHAIVRPVPVEALGAGVAVRLRNGPVPKPAGRQLDVQALAGKCSAEGVIVWRRVGGRVDDRDHRPHYGWRLGR